MIYNRMFSATIAAGVISSFGVWAHSQTATAEWLNPVSGNWTDATKWSTAPTYPNSNLYDVVLGAEGQDYVVQLGTDTVLHSLTIDSPSATLKQTSRTLTVQNVFTLDGGVYLSEGGHLANTAVSINNGEFRSRFNASLTNVTFQDSLSGTIRGLFTVYDGLELDSSILHLGTGGGFKFELQGTTNTLSGTGQIVFDSESGSLQAEGSSTSSMIIGEGIQIRTGLGNGSISATSNLIKSYFQKLWTAAPG